MKEIGIVGAQGFFGKSLSKSVKKLDFDVLENIMVTNTKKNELVSIVIPTYNRASFLKECINSVLNQSYKNFEIIIIDDSTTDEIEKICNEYASKLRYIRREFKGGISSAYNYAIKQLHGKWVKFLGDDNVLYKNFLEAMLDEVYRKNHHLIYSDTEFIDDKGNSIGFHLEKNYDNNYELAFALSRHMAFNFETLLINRSCFDTVGEFDTEFEVRLDQDWCLRACLAYDFHFLHLPKVLLKFRVHREQASYIDLKDAQKLKNQNITIKKIAEKNKKLTMDQNPERWNNFVSFQKNYRKKQKRNLLFNIKSSFLKPSYRILPYNFRKDLRRLWYTKIKSYREIKCHLCEIYNQQSYIYPSSEEKFVVCPNCSTHYELQPLSN